MPLIFQSGSNCTAGRLNSPNRLNGNAEDRGCACTIEDFDIAFDVYSQTNGCAAADLVPTSGRKAWGVLYEIPDDFIRGKRTDGQKTLAQIEGKRYDEKTIRVRNRNGKCGGRDHLSRKAGGTPYRPLDKRGIRLLDCLRPPLPRRPRGVYPTRH